MRTSIVIAAHNEGSRLVRTVQSCVETVEDLEPEILIVDDASSDAASEEVEKRFPHVRVVRHATREGVAPTKDHGARASSGDVIVFLDGHTKPEPGAIRRLVEDVEAFGGDALITPCVPALDCEAWKAMSDRLGFGFRMELEDFGCAWTGLQDLTRRGDYFENPTLVGCAMAMSRKLYETLWGFDRDMIEWGQEDLDFGLKTWLMGYSILCDPRAIIAHRFRDRFDNYGVSSTSALVNTLRIARKNFTEPVWEEWLEEYRRRHAEEDWQAAWPLFEARRESLERERAYLHAHRVHDELWYAEKFGLRWPARGGA